MGIMISMNSLMMFESDDITSLWSWCMKSAMYKYDDNVWVCWWGMSSLIMYDSDDVAWLWSWYMGVVMYEYDDDTWEHPSIKTLSQNQMWIL